MGTQFRCRPFRPRDLLEPLEFTGGENDLQAWSVAGRSLSGCRVKETFRNHHHHHRYYHMYVFITEVAAFLLTARSVQLAVWH